MQRKYQSSLRVVDGMLDICMSSGRVDDDSIMQWCSWALDAIPAYVEKQNLQRRSDGILITHEVNFEKNEIGDRGMLALLRTLHKLQLGVRILKVFRNCLGQASACSLAHFIVESPLPLWELHASHNYINRQGAMYILEAVAQQSKYPALRDGKNLPLWLRLEYNCISDAATFVESAEKAMVDWRAQALATPGCEMGGGNMICPVPFYPSGHCKNKFCQAAAAGTCPLVHLTSIGEQSDMTSRAIPAAALAWRAATNGEIAEKANWSLGCTAQDLVESFSEEVNLNTPMLALPSSQDELLALPGPPPPPPGAPSSVGSVEKLQELVDRRAAMHRDAITEVRQKAQIFKEAAAMYQAAESRVVESERLLQEVLPITAGPDSDQQVLLPVTAPPAESAPHVHSFREDEEDTRRYARERGSHKGRGRGRGPRRRPQIPEGRREPVCEERKTGQLKAWKGRGKGSFGWILPSRPIDHPDAQMHDGDIFISQKDLEQDIDVGTMVSFLLYQDNRGLGAAYCRKAVD